VSHWIDELRELAELFEAGVLEQAEFAELKRAILPSAATDPNDFPCQVHKLARCDQCAQSFQWVYVCIAHRESTCRLCVALNPAPSALYEASDNSNQRVDFVKWTCTNHGRLNCRSCISSIRASRGSTGPSDSLDWQCHDHGITYCKDCYYYP
jgi:hypothetical protein